MEPTRPRTYTLVHDTGVTVTVPSIELAAALTGWSGWSAAETKGREPVGFNFKGAKKKSDLADYARAMGIEGVDPDTTRADMESTILDWHKENS